MLDARFFWVAWVAMIGATVAVLHREPEPEPEPQAHMTMTAERPAEAVPTHGRSIRVARSPDGLFYLDGEVNAKPVRFLVDTGATTVVLSPADAARVGVTPGAGSGAASMQTTTGAAAMRWASARRIVVAGREIRNADVALPEAGLQVSLLGQSVLSQFGPIILDGDQLTIPASAGATR